MSILANYKERFEIHKAEEMTVNEYLTQCKEDSNYYASAAERILTAIGEPEIVDTRKDERLSRIFSNRKIKTYPKSFGDFHGAADTIDQIVSFFKHASQGLEEAKQILYLLGPVGGGKCERKGTQISMWDGTYKNVENVIPGDVVVSINSEGNKVSKLVTNNFIISEKKQIIKVTTKRGLIFEGAPTHRIKTNDDWVRLDELHNNQFVATLRNHQFGDNIADENYLKILAYLIGDGNIQTCDKSVTFVNKLQKCGQDFTTAVRLMGADVTYNEKYLSYRIINGKNIISKLKDDNLTGKYSYEKHIPSFILSLTKPLISTFLSRLFATDGWAFTGSPCEIGYSSSSKQLATNVLTVLNKFGICARLTSKIPSINGKKHRRNYNVIIRDKDHILLFLNEIGIFGKEDACQSIRTSLSNQKRRSSSFDRIPKNIIRSITSDVLASKKDGTSKLKDQLRTTCHNNVGVHISLIKEAANIFNNKLLQSTINDIYWDQIKSVEITDIYEEMYDFEVEGLHNYIANGIISHNSSIAERLKEVMENIPIYVLKAYNKATEKWEISPMYESPLGLFDQHKDGDAMLEEYGIPKRALRYIMSPWAVKRLEEVDGDLTEMRVVKMWPSVLKQIGITKVEPGDENNQDISSLVGKVNMRLLEDLDQDDPDAYSFKGGLNVATQGMMEFVEMFKAPIKMLHPLLTATQEGHYNGTEQFGAIPFQGIIVAHSNESEWQAFRNNRNNEAFLDRVFIIKVPYCLSVQEEIHIYEKLIANSELAGAPIAPGTLEMMARYSILTRLKEPANGNFFSKMEIYDGKNLKDKDPKAKSLEEYRDDAGVREGMDGSSTRFAYKILSKVFNFDTQEIAANPIHLMHVLENTLKHEELGSEEEDRRISFIKGILAPHFAEFIADELQKAYLESYHEYGQNLFERYIQLADFWIQDKDYRDPDTGENFNRDALNAELEKVEKAAGIGNPKDFRNEVVGFVIRYRADNNGNSPDWTGYEKLREVIEKKMFTNTEELLPVISFGKKSNSDDENKHHDFVQRMIDKNYTEKQVRLSVEWHLRYDKNN